MSRMHGHLSTGRREAGTRKRLWEARTPSLDPMYALRAPYSLASCRHAHAHGRNVARPRRARTSRLNARRLGFAHHTPGSPLLQYLSLRMYVRQVPLITFLVESDGRAVQSQSLDVRREVAALAASTYRRTGIRRKSNLSALCVWASETKRCVYVSENHLDSGAGEGSSFVARCTVVVDNKLSSRG